MQASRRLQQRERVIVLLKLLLQTRESLTGIKSTFGQTLIGRGGSEKMKRWNQLILAEAQGVSDEANVVVNQGIWQLSTISRPLKTGGQGFPEADGSTGRREFTRQTQHKS